MEKTAKIVRIITVAPIMALLLCSLLYIYGNNFSNYFIYLLCILCLALLPAFSYPIERKFKLYQKVHPNLSLRQSERNLAINLSVFSYSIISIIVSLSNQNLIIKEMILTYLISGIFMWLFTFALKINASGHMCGFIGPTIFLAYSITPWFLLLLIFSLPIIWSSLKLKRHSLKELFIGSLIPVLSFLFSLIFYNCLLFL